MDQSFKASVRSALQANDTDAAKRLCKLRLQNHPTCAEAHRYLGQIYSLVGDFPTALHHGKRASEFAPQSAVTWSDYGRTLALAKETNAAISAFKRATRIDRNFVDGWHNLGAAYLEAENEYAAFDAFKTVLQIDPTRTGTYLSLGSILKNAGQIEEALGCFQRAAKYDDGCFGASAIYARELLAIGQLDAASEVLKVTLKNRPKDVEARVALGEVCEACGEAEFALEHYEAAMHEQPDHPMAIGQALRLTSVSANSELPDSAEKVVGRPDLADGSVALIAYGLANYYNRARNVDDAVRLGRQANAARRRLNGTMDRSGLRSRADNIIKHYDSAFFAERQSFGIEDSRPVFVVGLPRSGTTLCEQIVSAHPLCHGAGELQDLPRIASLVSGAGRWPWQAALQLSQSQSTSLAHDYLNSLIKGSDAESQVATDKTPLNFFHLAFAALLFPNARVVHCTRDRRDNGLSIWLENFAHDQQWSTDLSDIKVFSDQHDRIMAHWTRALPLPILEVSYESVIADVEREVRRLLGFLGLPWDPRCLNFHQNQRSVQTPSRWQVRQPLYTGSVARWKAYRTALPELVSLGYDSNHSQAEKSRVG